MLSVFNEFLVVILIIVVIATIEPWTVSGVLSTKAMSRFFYIEMI